MEQENISIDDYITQDESEDQIIYDTDNRAIILRILAQNGEKFLGFDHSSQLHSLAGAVDSAVCPVPSEKTRDFIPPATVGVQKLSGPFQDIYLTSHLKSACQGKRMQLDDTDQFVCPEDWKNDEIQKGHEEWDEDDLLLSLPESFLLNQGVNERGIQGETISVATNREAKDMEDDIQMIDSTLDEDIFEKESKEDGSRTLMSSKTMELLPLSKVSNNEIEEIPKELQLQTVDDFIEQNNASLVDPVSFQSQPQEAHGFPMVGISEPGRLKKDVSKKLISDSDIGRKKDQYKDGVVVGGFQISRPQNKSMHTTKPKFSFRSSQSSQLVFPSQAEGSVMTQGTQGRKLTLAQRLQNLKESTRRKDQGCVSSSQFDGGALFDVSATEKEEILEFDISELTPEKEGNRQTGNTFSVSQQLQEGISDKDWENSRSRSRLKSTRTTFVGVLREALVTEKQKRGRITRNLEKLTPTQKISLDSLRLKIVDTSTEANLTKCFCQVVEGQEFLQPNFEVGSLIDETTASVGNVWLLLNPKEFIKVHIEIGAVLKVYRPWKELVCGGHHVIICTSFVENDEERI